jgi:hypothetical protein
MKEVIETIRSFNTKDWDNSPKVIACKEYDKRLEEHRRTKMTEINKYDFYRGWEYACDYLLAVIDGTVGYKFPEPKPTTQSIKDLEEE